MIPVTLQPEPNDFDANVRQKGIAALAALGLKPNAPLRKNTEIPALWSYSNKALWEAYSGICAYLAIRFEWVTGASSTDHFVPKSQDPFRAYDWDNYRLSTLAPNRTKNKHRDVLDPIGLVPETFYLNLVSGEIRPNPSLSRESYRKAEQTIKRLKLDSPEHNKMRQRRYSYYIRNRDVDFLKEESPFIWHEATRQGLL